MKTSPAGINLIKSFEGLRLTAYADANYAGIAKMFTYLPSRDNSIDLSSKEAAERALVENSEFSIEVLRRVLLATKLNDITGCLEWIGKSRANGGYGRLAVSRNAYLRANRAMLIIATGVIPSGKYACHSCDNPLCVQPDHLFWGTAEENTRDMIVKGRMKVPPVHKGEGHHNATLSYAQVLDIRADKVTPSEVLGGLYGVSGRTVRRIRRMETRVEA